MTAVNSPARTALARTVSTRARAALRTPAALGGWCAVVAAGALAAYAVRGSGARISINAPPLHGRFDPVFGIGLVAPVAVASTVIAAAPRVLTRGSWRQVLAASTGSAAAWAVALAMVRGTDRIVSPVRGPREYLAALPMLHDPLAFVDTFVDRIRDYPVHVQGHPPGTVLVLAALRDVGLGGPTPAAVLFVAGGAAAVAAVLVALREVVGEASARRAAPFVVLAPAAIWVATSADALYAGVATWGAALVIVATGRCGPRADLAAAAGGLLLAAAAFGSYGLVLAAIVPLAVAYARRSLRPVLIAGAAVAGLASAFALAGFVWIDGLAATRERYLAGIASSRPYLPFLLVNVAALALALGPGIAVALSRIRSRTLLLVVGAALTAVAIANLSGMAKGEVERIWLPFTPWLLAAGITLVPAPFPPRTLAPRWRSPARWLALQAATAIALETIVRTAW